MVNCKTTLSSDNSVNDQMFFSDNRDDVTFRQSCTRKPFSLWEYLPRNILPSCLFHVPVHVHHAQTSGLATRMLCDLPRCPHDVLSRFLFPPRQFSLFRQCDLTDWNHTFHAHLSARSFKKKLYSFNIRRKLEWSRDITIRFSLQTIDVKRLLYIFRC